MERTTKKETKKVINNKSKNKITKITKTLAKNKKRRRK